MQVSFFVATVREISLTVCTFAQFARLVQGERTPLKTDDCVDPRGSAFCDTCVGTIGTAGSSCGVNGKACLSTPAQIAVYGLTTGIVCACKDNSHTIGKCKELVDATATCVGTVGTAGSSCGVNGKVCLSTPAQLAPYGRTTGILRVQGQF